MTALDWILLLVVGISALLGVLRGLIGIAVSLAAWLLAGSAAWLFGGDVGRSLVTDGQLGWGEYLGGYALSFVVVWVAVALLGLLVRRIAHSAGLSEVDRLFGLGLGLVRGVFFGCALLLLLGMTSVPGKPTWRDSTGVAMLLPGAAWMRSCMPPWMQQRVDLEGRGTSLQNEAQALQKVLPQGLPAALPESIPEAIPHILPRVLPQAAPRPDPEMVPPGHKSDGAQAKRVKSDDAPVH